MSDTSSSGHSLHSQGYIINPFNNSSTHTQNVHKKAAKWIDNETSMLLHFLGEMATCIKARDGVTFKKPEWNTAASLLIENCPEFKRGMKDVDVYKHRFTVVCFLLTVSIMITDQLSDEETI